MVAKRRHPTNTRLAIALSLVVATLAAALAGTANGRQSSHASAVQIIRVSTHSFDWGDAGIGAAGGIGISMLAVGAALLITGNRQNHNPPPRLTAKEQS